MLQLRLKILTGPASGQVVHIAPGFKIGRLRGDLLLDDPKISTLHAFFENEGESLWLVDNGSKNGIWIGNERITRVEVRPGLGFRIGLYNFEVLSPSDPNETGTSLQEVNQRIRTASETKKTEFDETLPPQQPTEVIESTEPSNSFTNPAGLDLGKVPTVNESLNSRSTSIEASRVFARSTSSGQGIIRTVGTPATTDVSSASYRSKRWSDRLIEALAKYATLGSDSALSIRPFNPPLRLSFVAGGQMETEWILGYGPRKAGAKSADLAIYEPEAPEICFVLHPSSNGVEFGTSYPKLVKINGSCVDKKVLVTGDVITIGDTAIEVSYQK